MSFQIQLLEESLEKIRPRQAEFAARFYQTLFAKHPEIKPYFAHTDMEKQQQMLVAALFLIVRSLEKPQMLSMTVKGLGERHIRYGAEANLFPCVGEALFATFADCLGADWTVEIKQSWVSAYQTITQKMLEAMKKEVA